MSAALEKFVLPGDEILIYFIKSVKDGPSNKGCSRTAVKIERVPIRSRSAISEEIPNTIADLKCQGNVFYLAHNTQKNLAHKVNLVSDPAREVIENITETTWPEQLQQVIDYLRELLRNQEVKGLNYYLNWGSVEPTRFDNVTVALMQALETYELALTLGYHKDDKSRILRVLEESKCEFLKVVKLINEADWN